VFDLSHKLRERGWIISAYTLPPKAESIAIIRIVVKENFSRDMADILFADLLRAMDDLKIKKQKPLKAPKEKHHPVC
jgi:glutamate decarboxylase